ncbi:MAG: C10 family peptidase [Tannerellaceae bacterium]|jgi:uncharacterized protein YjdB|nr:C10 family peptidase [Tannerellaceae bacterium]
MRRILLFVFLFLMTFAGMAQNRSEAEAMDIAKSFLARHGRFLRSSIGQGDALRLAYTSKSLLRSTAGKPYFYVFNRGANDGFILVSADGRTKDVLGYADEGTFDFKNLPDNFKYWLGFYESEFASLDNPQTGTMLRATAQQDGQTQMNDPLTGPLAPSVNPLVKAKWNQNAPYYNSCPTISGTRTYTGCVATAMAQIMYYHRHPAQGTGYVSYTPPNVGSSVSANFGVTTYQWNDMLDRYSSSATSAQQQAVATLMFHCGVAVKMQYGTSSSGAYSFDVPSALENYFGYDSGVSIYKRNHYSYANWSAMIKEELTNNRPVYYGGVTSSGGGHAFVCDGYSSDDFFHFNWGWGSTSDGYFELSALNPKSLGIGGGTGGYNYDQDIIIGIKPAVPGSVPSTARISFVSVSSNKKSFDTTTPVTVTLKSVFNTSSKPFDGYIGLAIYQNNSLINYWAKFQTNTLNPRYGYGSAPFSNMILPSLPDGEYTIVPVYSHSTDENTPIPMEWKEGGVHELKLNISNGKALINDIMPKQPALALDELKSLAQMYQGKGAVFNAKITNSGPADYKADLRILLDNSVLTTEPVVIPSGTTKTLAFSATIPASTSTGAHTAKVQYDQLYGVGSSQLFTDLGSQINVTVNAAPAAPLLKIVSGPTFANSAAVNKWNPQMTVVIKNDGGLYDGALVSSVAPDYIGSPNLLKFGQQQILIDNNETKTILFNTPIELDPGNYRLQVYYYDRAWLSLSSYASFTLVDSPSAAEPLSLVPTSTNYNGQPQAGFNFTNQGGSQVNLTVGTDYTVTYAGRNQTSYSSSNPPTNAGDYKATIALKPSLTGYTLPQTSVDFTIQRRTLSDATVAPIPAIVYNGAQQLPASITVKIGNTTLAENSDYSFATTSGGLNVGTATLTITGNGNYKDTKTATYEISKRAITFANVAAKNKVYDGSTTAEITYSITAGNIVAGEIVSLNFNASFPNANVGNGKAVTVQTLTLAGANAANYEAPTIPTGLAANISAAPYSYNVAQPVQVVVGAALSTVQMPLPVGVSINGTPETVQGTGAWYQDASANTPVAAGYTFVAGRTTLYYKFTAAAGNYDVNPKITAVDFDAVNGLPQSISFDAASPVNKTFGDLAFINAAKNNTAGGNSNFIYRSGDTTIATVNATTGEVTIKKVGKVNIYAKAPAVPGKFAETEADYVLNIATRDLTSTNTDVKIAGAYIYNGSPQSPAATNLFVTLTVNGVPTTLNGTTDYSSSVTAGGTNAGNAVVTVSGTGNYSGTVTGSFNIAKYQLTATAAAAAKTYDGTTDATVVITLNNIIGSDVVSAKASGTFASKDVGSNKTVTISNLTLSGGAKDNYIEPVVSSTTANITPANYDYLFTTTQKTVIDGETFSSVARTITPASGVGVNVPAGGTKETVTGNILWFTDAQRLNQVSGNYAFALSVPQVTLYWAFTATDANYNSAPKTGQVVFDVQNGAAQNVNFPSTTLSKEFGTAAFSFVAVNATNNGGNITYSSTNPAVADISANGTVTIHGAGTATLTAVAAQVPGFFARTEANCILTVTPRTIAAAEMLIAGTLTYNGTAQMPAPANVSVKLNGNPLTYSTDYIFNSANAGTDAGEYILTVTGTGNYKDNVSKKFTIAKKPLTINIASTQVDAKTYDNTADATVSSVAFNGLEGTQSLVINTDYTVAGATFNNVNAGMRDVAANVLLISNAPTAKNYFLANGTFTKTGVAINKATVGGVSQSFEVKAGLAKSYSYNAAKLLPSVTGVLGHEQYVLGTVTNVDNVLALPLTFNGPTLTIPVNNVAAAGKTATVNVDVSSDNYNTFTSTVTVTTVVKTPVVISGLTLNNKIYDGQPYAYSGSPVVAKAVDGANVNIASLDKLYESTDGAGYSSDRAPTAAGAYSLTLSVPASDATYSGSIVYNFNIEKKPVKIKANDAIITVGQSQPAYTYTVEGQVANDQVIASGTPALTCPGYVDAPGRYAIVPNIAGVTLTGNYLFDTQPTVNGALTVVAAGGLVTGVTLDPVTLSLYVGNTSTMVVTVLPVGTTGTGVVWTTSDAGVATVNNGVVTAIAVGEAIITVKTNVGGYTASCKVTVKEVAPPVLSSDATLFRLSIDEAQLTPNFNPSVNDYSASVSAAVASINVKAVASHALATVTGDGLHNLQPGGNTIAVAVEAEDGTTNTYRIVVTRSTGVANEELADKLNIYFDPSYATIFVQSDITVKTIAIYDLLGRKQLSENPYSAGTVPVNIAKCGKGLYILRIETANGTTTVKIAKKL